MISRTFGSINAASDLTLEKERLRITLIIVQLKMLVQSGIFSLTPKKMAIRISKPLKTYWNHWKSLQILFCKNYERIKQ